MHKLKELSHLLIIYDSSHGNLWCSRICTGLTLTDTKVNVALCVNSERKKRARCPESWPRRLPHWYPMWKSGLKDVGVFSNKQPDDIKSPTLREKSRISREEIKHLKKISKTTYPPRSSEVNKQLFYLWKS